jgi:protein TonB
MQRHTLIAVLALAVFATMPAHAADKPAPSASSAHAVAAPAERAPEVQPSAQLATPQPAFRILPDLLSYIRPGAPAAASAPSHGTTIAPFPLPWDTSRATAGRMQLLNVPRAGQLTIAPLPPPAGVEGGVYFDTPPAPQADPKGTGPVQPRLPIGDAPVYPEAARKAGVQGTVWMRVHVLADGSVGEASVLAPLAPALDAAALEAVKHWRYTPPVLEGKPTSTWLVVPVQFTLH